VPNIHVALVRVSGRADTGATAQVTDSIPVSAPQTITSAGSSTESSVKAPDTGWEGLFWEVAVDAAAFIAMGSNPTAGANAGRFLPIAGTYNYAVEGAGEEIAVKFA